MDQPRFQRFQHFAAARAISGLWSALSARIPRRCLFCEQSGVRDGTCASCAAALPWNEVSCVLCAQPLPTAIAAHRCSRCSTHPPHFDHIVAPFRYEAPIQPLIHALKYRARFDYADWLGERIAAAVINRPEPLPECLIPVPLHASRLRLRGYNQARELARGICRRLQIPIEQRRIIRKLATPDQIGRDARERARNVSKAFAAVAPLPFQHIAIVDDVVTTGSTVDAVAAVCRAAGASRIEVWCAARAP